MKKIFLIFAIVAIAGCAGVPSCHGATQRHFDCPVKDGWQSRITRVGDSIVTVSNRSAAKYSDEEFKYETPYYRAVDGIYVGAEWRGKDTQKIRMIDTGSAMWSLEGQTAKCAGDADGVGYVCAELCDEADGCRKIDAKIEPVGDVSYVMTPDLSDGGADARAFYLAPGEDGHAYYSPAGISVVRIDGDAAFFGGQVCK